MLAEIDASTRRRATTATTVGRGLTVAGLCAWLVLLAWQLTTPMHAVLGVVTVMLEVLAWGVALVITAALWSTTCDRPTRSDDRSSLPDVFGALVSIDRSLVDLGDRRHSIVGRPVGADDTGEVVRARRGLHVAAVAVRHRSLPSTADAAWAAVALEGIRRLLCVGLVVLVLISGRSPLAVPGWAWLASFAVSIAAVSVGHWFLSSRRIRPGSRLVWSMASIGAGLGDGVSRSALPIRWVATMATIVLLNLAVALRGLSDRWTHGLGPMAHDARVAAMSVGLGLVGLGFVALRTLPQPDVDLYGATRRLEETSARRLALVGTVGVALVGFAAGVAPGAGSM